MELLYSARSWVLAHLDLVGPPLFYGIVLVVLLQLLLAWMVRDRLPDAQTGFRRSDGFPMTPPAQLRSWAFLFGPRGMEISGPAGRGLIRLFRLVTVLVYVTLALVFVAEVTDGYVFDPDAEILQTDSQRLAESGR